MCSGPDMCPDAPDSVTRCAACEVTRLEDAMESRNGLLLRSALDLDFSLRAHLTVGLDDLTAFEFRALKTVRMERDRHDSEKR